MAFSLTAFATAEVDNLVADVMPSSQIIARQITRVVCSKRNELAGASGIKDGKLALWIWQTLDANVSKKIDGKASFDECWSKISTTKLTSAQKQDPWTQTTVVDFLGLICMLLAKSTGGQNIAKRIKTAHNISHVPIPNIVEYVIEILEYSNDFVIEAHNLLWRYPDLAKSTLNYVIAHTDLFPPHGPEIIKQTLMTMSYAQMTFVKQINAILMYDDSKLKITRAFVDEVIRMRDTLKDLSKNSGVNEAYLRLLRVNGSHELEASKFPFCSAVTYHFLADAKSSFKFNINQSLVKVVARLASEQLPDGYKSGTLALDDEQLKAMNLSKPPDAAPTSLAQMLKDMVKAGTI